MTVHTVLLSNNTRMYGKKIFLKSHPYYQKSMVSFQSTLVYIYALNVRTINQS